MSHIDAHFLISRARELGLTIEKAPRVEGKGWLNFPNTRWCIAGMLCKFQVAGTPKDIKGRLFWKFITRFEPGSYEFVIFQAGTGGVYTPRHFIVPAELVSMGKNIYIPLAGRSKYNKVEPIVDWLDYENRWDLLTKNEPVAILATKT